MAAIWKGSLTFGLVNIPVELRKKTVAASRKVSKAKKAKTA
jgi:non-homologous end joining protein Ku